MKENASHNIMMLACLAENSRGCLENLFIYSGYMKVTFAAVYNCPLFTDSAFCPSYLL